ncbi:MAG TPA: hypothetical protein PKM25_16295, partial [Candidatus Ozemobacteraceae bacterium]|nr:hypothetical protein [Candidatus Ozemobacteraceae bacterium]
MKTGQPILVGSAVVIMVILAGSVFAFDDGTDGFQPAQPADSGVRTSAVRTSPSATTAQQQASPVN